MASARSVVLVVALFSACISTARAEQPVHPTVAVLEYRAGARGAVDIGERLADLLVKNAAFSVVSPREARRRIGARVDAEVAHCAGDPACLARIGAQLDAGEVLSIGISQLGDVVIALSRIDVNHPAQRLRLAESLAPESEPSDTDLLGWLRQLYPPEAFRRFGAIRIKSDVDGAEVRINGEPRGKTPLANALSLRAPASYQLELGRRGYLPFAARIDLLPDATVEVRASLSPSEHALVWYKRWYVWAIIGGTLAAAGGGLAIYYGTRTSGAPQGFITFP